jgi:hypothetical protein
MNAAINASIISSSSESSDKPFESTETKEEE